MAVNEWPVPGIFTVGPAARAATHRVGDLGGRRAGSALLRMGR